MCDILGSTSVALPVKDSKIIESQTVVKLLVTHIDVFKFDHHVSYTCSRASGQVNALVGLLRNLNEPCKLQLIKTFVAWCSNYCLLV